MDGVRCSSSPPVLHLVLTPALQPMLRPVQPMAALLEALEASQAASSAWAAAALALRARWAVAIAREEADECLWVHLSLAPSLSRQVLYWVVLAGQVPLVDVGQCPEDAGIRSQTQTPASLSVA